MKKISVCLTLLLTFMSAHPVSAENIELGAISVLSGEGASWGINHRRGSLLALEEINAGGGVRNMNFAIRFEDSPSGLARNAVSAFQRLLLTQEPRIILGPLMQDEFEAVAPLADRKNILLLVPTYIPLRKGLHFSTWIDSPTECQRIAKKIFKRHKTVAILGSTQSWEYLMAKEFKRAFISLGGHVVADINPSFDNQDVRSEMLKISAHNPDAVFISSYLLLPQYARSLKELKSKAPLYSIELDQSAISASSGYVDDLVFIAPAPPSQDFQERFIKRWKAPADIPAERSYRALLILAEAIRAVGQEPSAIHNYLNRTYPDFPKKQASSFYRVNGDTIVAESDN